MFRKNYLPKVQISQEIDTKKWFAYKTGDGTFSHEFCQLEDGSYEMLWHCSNWHRATMFGTLDDLVEALYYYAMQKHLKSMKSSLTYNTVNIKT